ncbi:phospholipase [Paracoccus sp. Z118]|uniref:phospholipase D-like domain-containing protein n=1 Tax=Paracoccus sp. Z118 TaxID=2851017 RepID=UPI001C2C11DE|nr:phospholipase D-like domain-containing protein [Paracoccus sp. Z118]MBV0892439.1 phospholipase [Paracoccus sp. Z118]
MTEFSLQPGRNCWRTARADRFTLIVDAQHYFRALREALLKARDEVLMIGWDFDFEIEMLPGESDGDGIAPDGLPNKVGPFLEELVARHPELDIYLLKWSGGALIAPARLLPGLRVKLFSPEQVHFALDGRHPLGACHHQKIVVVDDSLAFCGGIDVTDGRWDTRDHLTDEARRCLKSGETAQPWHDAAGMFDGPAVLEMAELARGRWHRATDEEIAPADNPGRDLWPPQVDPDFSDVQIGISRTEPPGFDHRGIVEIETQYLDAIRAAKDCIYIESQYFSAPGIARAIRRRLAEPDGPEIVVINPRAAQNFIEDRAMHVSRGRLIRQLARRDRYGRFRILYPVTEAGEPIYVHAKLLLVDDALLRVGSSNIDRRSMGFDTEVDVTLIAETDAHRACIRRIRAGLLAEHLGRTPEEVQAAIDGHGGLIAAIDALSRPEGRGLWPVPRRRDRWLGRWLADTAIFDPRYARDAERRTGLTGRHWLIGAGALAAAALLWRRTRRR